MGLRLIIGRAGTGKSELCLREIAENLKERPDGSPLIYIVPEQATFQAEYALNTSYGLQGTIRAQVLSFRRLAWKVMQESGGGKRLFIDDTGKGMVLRKVLEKRKGDLKVFRHAGEQAGVLENLIEIFNELKRSCIPVSQFRETFHKRLNAGENLPSLFKEKMNDLILILEGIIGELGENYLDAEDYLDLLTLQMPGSSFLKGAEVWVDGFYGFTNQEYNVLEGLLRRCPRVTVTACLDRDRPPEEKLDELDPFYPVAVTCRKVQHRAEACLLPVEKVTMEGEQTWDGGTGPLSQAGGEQASWDKEPVPLSQDLVYLERNLQRYPVKPYGGEMRSLSLAAAPNRRCEVESMAREMIRRVRDEGFRWRDMAVIVNDLGDYGDTVSTVFADYNIPIFLDQKRTVMHHPLVEFIRSAMKVVNRNWRYDAVFRCIKTEFPLPRFKDGEDVKKWRERADRLENYVLAFGIQGTPWLWDKPWEYRERDSLEDDGETGERISEGEDTYLKMINETRWELSGPLVRFQEQFRKAVTVREKTSALYGLMEDVNAWERLEYWSKKAMDLGNPEKAREHLQVYKGIIELMDQVVEIMGEEKISSALFARIVESGLEALRLSLVPPSLDQVLIGNMERSRSGHVKLVYLLGVNDGVLPSRPREDGILSEEEREAMSGWGLELAPGSRRRLFDEQYLIYMALTRASEGLRISYPLADEEGRSLVPSLLLAHLKEIFPSLREDFVSAEPENPNLICDSEFGSDFSGTDVTYKTSSCHEHGLSESCKDGDNENHDGSNNTVNEVGDAAGENVKGNVGENAAGDGADAGLLSYLAHPRRTLSHLAVQLSRWKKGAEIHTLWWEVYNWYSREASWREQAGRLLGGIFYENRENPLSVETSMKVYGKHLRASVSRLERFRACPFSHFISHGLRLKERQTYKLESPDIGRFFHAALRNFAVSLQGKGLEWGGLSRDECLKLAAEEVERLVPRLQKEILLSSGRYRYLAEKLSDTVGRAVVVLGEHASRSSFRPVGLEISFGRGGTLPEQSFELENDVRVELAGRIDRVDLAYDDQGRAFLRVIDYKSGRNQLKLPEIFYGLSLQMLTYLDIVLTHALQWLGEEALPAGVLYFRVHTPMINTSGPLPPDKIEQEIRKCYKMNGLVLEDPEVVQLMDNLLESGYSEIIPVGLSKDKIFYKNSSTLTEERFNLLRRHIHHLIKATTQNMASGQVDILPYRLGKKKACTYCPYKGVCQFDTALEGNNFRILRNEEKELIWQNLEKGPDGGNEK
ncbi:MAG: exodeoxyribonuclease V subunit gamma [Bacillota bacterium]|nr:exodeoxyribonuclease V subunit gamma [Bacillota bacterium]